MVDSIPIQGVHRLHARHVDGGQELVPVHLLQRAKHHGGEHSRGHGEREQAQAQLRAAVAGVHSTPDGRHSQAHVDEDVLVQLLVVLPAVRRRTARSSTRWTAPETPPAAWPSRTSTRQGAAPWRAAAAW